MHSIILDEKSNDPEGGDEIKGCVKIQGGGQAGETLPLDSVISDFQCQLAKGPKKLCSELFETERKVLIAQGKTKSDGHTRCT